MEKRRVHGIHGIFQDLQPVARIIILLARDELVSRSRKAVIDRERRLYVGRPHVGKDDAIILMRGIGPMTEPVLQGTVCRFTRGLQDCTVYTEEPAVIAAADPLIRDQPIFQRGPSMRTVQLQHTHLASKISEGDEIFA
jgi:hypothetical protein